MKLDATLRAVELRAVPDESARAEALGFDGVFVTERNSDPFLALALAARATGRVDLGTAAALAFPRSPMEVAYTAWDLQGLSDGRFQLGLATQVRAHVERRYGAQLDGPQRGVELHSSQPKPTRLYGRLSTSAERAV